MTSVEVDGIQIDWAASMDTTEADNAVALLSQDASLAMIRARAEEVRAGFVVSKIRIRWKGHDTTNINGVSVPDPKGGHVTLWVHPPVAAPGAGKISMHLYYDPNTADLDPNATPREAV